MYTVHQAKTNLSKLIEEATRGEEVIIARGKEPVARLVPITRASQKRVPGRLKGMFREQPGCWDAMTPDDLSEWGVE